MSFYLLGTSNINPAFKFLTVGTISEKTISPFQGFGFSFLSYPGRRELAFARFACPGLYDFRPFGA
jgi:hypothetical protein